MANKGTIKEVIDHGSIVTLLVEGEERVHAVNFDHRMFQHFYDDNGPDLVGLEVEVETVEGQEVVYVN